MRSLLRWPLLLVVVQTPEQYCPTFAFVFLVPCTNFAGCLSRSFYRLHSYNINRLIPELFKVFNSDTNSYLISYYDSILDLSVVTFCHFEVIMGNSGSTVSPHWFKHMITQ